MYADITFPIVLEGRTKVYYQCKQSSHIKTDCTVLQCWICRQLGHDDVDCTKNRLYVLWQTHRR